MDGRSYVKKPLRSSAILNIENDDKYCFLWSILAYIHPLNKLSINIIELSFYQDQTKWRQKLIPIEVSKKYSDGVFDLLVNKNHYALIKKMKAFLGDHHKNFISRRCLNSYTSENMLS